MDVNDAIYATVHDYQGGAPALAARLQEQGCTVMAMPSVADVGNDELMFKQQELGRLANKLRSSIQNDGHIDRGERADLYEEARTIYQKAHELVAVAVLVYGEK